MFRVCISNRIFIECSLIMKDFKILFKPYSALIITGGSSGIGKAFIDYAYKYSNSIFIFNLSRSIPANIFPDSPALHIPCDLTDQQQIRAAVEAIKAVIKEKNLDQGKIMLINNSGFGSYGYFPEPNAEHHAQMISVNATAPILLTALLLPILKSQGGSIINISSTSAFQPTAYMATYGASKIFLLHWSLALNQELKPENIPVIAVCPGPTSTAFFKKAGFNESPLKSGWKGLTVDDVVQDALNSLTRKKSMIICGWNNKLLAALAGSLPKRLAAYLTRIVLKKIRLEQYKK